ncbi:MAG: hypothetical protein JNL01_07455 [Bdellovibrionales bacterium]|nr:hypothetical protein [Bdellovibrionales bacterium]
MKTKYFQKVVFVSGLTVAIAGCAGIEFNQQEYVDPIVESARLLREGRSPASAQMASHASGDPDEIQTRAASIQRAVDVRDLAIGMSMEQVRASWGEPRDVAIAGNPDHGNQRWTYREVASRYFGGQSDRTVYFEDGKVAGWKTRKP